MPIRPENRNRYPTCWKVLSYCIRADRAGWECEWCRIANGTPTKSGGKVVLTVAHMDHIPENCSMMNLVALCQKCHNGYDAPQRRANKRQRLDNANGQLPLFG